MNPSPEEKEAGTEGGGRRSRRAEEWLESFRGEGAGGGTTVYRSLPALAALVAGPYPARRPLAGSHRHLQLLLSLAPATPKFDSRKTLRKRW